MAILKRQPLIAWTPKTFTYHQGLPPPNANKGKLKADMASSGALRHLKMGKRTVSYNHDKPVRNIESISTIC